MFGGIIKLALAIGLMMILNALGITFTYVYLLNIIQNTPLVSNFVTPQLVSGLSEVIDITLVYVAVSVLFWIRNRMK